MDGSILYHDGIDDVDFGTDSFFQDLRLDGVLAEITGPGDGTQYRRKPRKASDVQFRLAVMQDLERREIGDIAGEFTNRFGLYQTYLGYARDLPQRQTKQKWLLDAACMYCGCVNFLHDSLEKALPQSEGLRRFLESLDTYMHTEEFTTLRNDAERCAERLGAVQYTLDVWLYQNKVAVRPDPGGAEDACARLSAVFRRFGLAESPRIVPFPGVNMESLELEVLERLEELYPGEFALLDEFCKRHPAVGSKLIETFTAELRFYRSYIAYMGRMKEKGYGFSYPVFHGKPDLRIAGGYDLSLAQAGGAKVTPNDLVLNAGESCIVTGPNQGGKTACVRMAGQVAYFASLGLPAPCQSVQTRFLEGLYTHFAKEEDLSNNYGRLKEELQRAKCILDGMPQGSLLLFNDLFSSTTAYDAAEIGKRLLASLAERGCLCLFATSLRGLADPAQGIACRYAAPVEGTGEYRVTCEPEGRAHGDGRLAGHRLRSEDIRRRVR